MAALEVAAGRVTHDEDRVRIAAERLRVLLGPGHALHAAEERLGEAVLRSQGVVDVDNHHVALVTYETGHVVVGVDIAEHPAATVEIDDDGHPALGLWPVDPHPHGLAPVADHLVDNLADWPLRFRLAPIPARQLGVGLSSLCRRHLVEPAALHDLALLPEMPKKLLVTLHRIEFS